MATITYTVTVANSGSGNVFYIDGSPNPTLSFSRGNTYVFDVSDSTNSGHPLRFKDSNGASYTTDVTVTGTEGNAGAEVQIVVDASTPAALRYYCTVHGNGMGNTISVAFDSAFVALYGSGQYGKAEYGIVPGRATLTGVAATGAIAPVAINGLELDISENLASVSATGQIGTIKLNITKTVSGVAGTGAVSTVQENVGAGLTGVVGTGGIGTLSARSVVTVAISGVSATGQVGTVVESVSENLLSVSATGSIGTLTTTGQTQTFIAADHSKIRTFYLIPSQAKRVA